MSQLEAEKTTTKITPQKKNIKTKTPTKPPKKPEEKVETDESESDKNKNRTASQDKTKTNFPMATIQTKEDEKNEPLKGKKRPREEDVTSNAAPVPPTKKPRVQKGMWRPTPLLTLLVVIAFSSFKDESPFTNAMKENLTKLAQELGAEIQTAPQFEPEITHVVCH